GALSTISAPKIEKHVKDFHKYCPNNVYVSMRAQMRTPPILGHTLKPLLSVYGSQHRSRPRVEWQGPDSAPLDKA
ncbi:hypothetical protein BG006_008639, partial [Podila minutissima]